MKVLRILFILGFVIINILSFLPTRLTTINIKPADISYVPPESSYMRRQAEEIAPLPGQKEPEEKKAEKKFESPFERKYKVSDFELSRFFYRLVSFFTGFAIFLAIPILAIVYPKRWIFLTGAIIMSVSLLMAVIYISEGRSGEYLLFPLIITFVAQAFGLTGYFIKPVKLK